VPLRYPPFAASADLQQAALNNPPLKKGARGSAVALLQGGLIDLGHPLPVSTRKTGAPDGAFGNETFEALKEFQKKQKAPVNHPDAFKPDGVAGRNTITRMDELLLALHTAPHVPPPPPPPPPISPHYQLGSADPATSHDAGAGKWNSKPTTATSLALKLAILDILPSATVVIGDDAAFNMMHYLANSGRTINIDLEGMVKEVPSAKERYEAEVAQAQAFVEQLPSGTHEITSRMPQGGYNYKEENWNWFFAIGGYSTWGKGQARVKETPAGREFELDFKYKFYDRYNWDGGKSVTIFKIRITDEAMGEFHRQGIAQEYDCVGSFKRQLRWRQGQAIPQQQIDNPVGRG
jgi:hypothetical protein